MPSNAEWVIRRLAREGAAREQDIAEVKALCTSRSYMGKDIGEIFSFGELWADMVIDPYVTYAPELTWVAQGPRDDDIVGYLTGACDGGFYEHQDARVRARIDQLKTEGLFGMVGNPLGFWNNALSVIAGLNHRTIEFLAYLKNRAQQEIPDRPSTPHFNVFVRHDRRGIARALIRTFMADLRRRKVSQYHITALYAPDAPLKKRLDSSGFRVRDLDFFLSKYRLRDSLETAVFNPYELRIGCFERAVPQAGG